MPINILMPALSPTMTDGTLAKWHVKEGDVVSSGDIIADIETDKATMEVEAVDEGVIGKILVPSGEKNISVNSAIAILLLDGETMDDASLENVSQNDANAPESSESTAEKTNVNTAPPRISDTGEKNQKNSSTINEIKKDRIFISPLARRIAADKAVDIKAVVGTGPNGRIVKADIEKYLQANLNNISTKDKIKEQGQVSPQMTASSDGDKSADTPAIGAADNHNPFEPDYEKIPLNNMRKTIAQRLSQSKREVPHFYLSLDCVIDDMMDLRKKLNNDLAADSGKDGETLKISLNDMIIKAVANSLVKVPAANATFVPSDDAIKFYKHADIAVAVAIEGGLITPVIRSAETMGLASIANKMKSLAMRARDGKLMPEEYLGGTFSISNLGMYGIKNFSAVINPPQACILAVGAGEQRAIVVDGQIKIKTVMSVTLSVDHRAVDGAVGAEFLQAFQQIIENPLKLML